jgi:tRNA/rRNA methyltransferase
MAARLTLLQCPSTPIIILTRPQLVENIGAVARAMLNCGLAELRIVAPRDGWPQPTASGHIMPVMEGWIAERLFAASSGADEVLNNAQLFPDLTTALTDIHHVYATTARDHYMVKPWTTPKLATPIIQQQITDGLKIGILFGPERTGLTHDDMSFANEVLCIPANPVHSSFNLAQAVLIIAYEWYQAQETTILKPRVEQSRPATKAELHNLFERLEREMDISGFYTTEEMRPTMVRNVRNALQRATMTDQEIRTLHGVITALIDGPKRRKPPEGN